VAIGEELAASGARLATLSEVADLRLRGGSVPLGDLQRLAPKLVEAATLLRTSDARLAAIERTYLHPRLERAIDDLRNRVERQVESAESAAEGERLPPRSSAPIGPAGTSSPSRTTASCGRRVVSSATGGSCPPTGATCGWSDSGASRS
jgi:hypothetical protein